MTLNLRRLHKWDTAEVATVKAMVCDLHAYDNEFRPSLGLVMGWRDAIAKNVDIAIHQKGAINFVAAINDQVIGVVISTPDNLGSWIPDPDCYGIREVFVDPHFRGQGIGSKLLQVTLNEISLAGAKRASLYVHTKNWDAHALYKKFGFKANAYFMVKDLT